MNKILKKRLRDENNIPYGMVVAINANQLGYSICHSKLDKYDDEIAFKIAMSRARSNKDTNADFWINRRKRHLKDNPMTYIIEGDLDYYLNYKDIKIFSSNLHREIIALIELRKMEERAKNYYKDFE
jgi:hypothetical protein